MVKAAKPGKKIAKKTKKSAPEVSVIVPAYNAARCLEDSVLMIEREVKKTGIPFEILIVENASTDETPAIAANLAKRKSIRHLTNKEKGRGLALNKGFIEARGVSVVYIDADLDIPLKYVFEIVRELRSGYDIAIASKRHPKSKVGCPKQRKFLSRGYNYLVRAMLHSKVKGHQGGLKGFKKSVITDILPYVKDNKWFWDTEVLVIAQWMGYSIKEVPIRADYGFEGTTVVMDDISEMFSGIMNLRSRRKALKGRIARAK